MTSNNVSLKRGLALLAALASVGGPLGISVAQAKPGDHDRHGKPGGHGGWHKPGRPNPGRPSTQRVRLTGVVVNDLPGGQFSMRDGRRVVRVVLQSGVSEPRGLTRGSGVEVRGYFRGSTFYADDVNLVNRR